MTWNRRAVRAAVAVLIGATGMVGFGFPAVPSEASQADGIHWLLHPQVVTFDEHGVSYQLRMRVSDGSWHLGGGDGYEREQVVKFIVASQTRAGSRMHAVQTAYYTFSIDFNHQPGFSHPESMNTATLSAWDRYGHLRIRLKFVASAAPSASCDGHTVTRPGRLTGSLFFRPPHSQLGTIHTVATRATLTHGDGTCAIGYGEQPQFINAKRCAAGTYVAMGRATPSWLPLSFFARRDPGSDTATINVTSTSDAANPHVWRTIVATVPASHVDISSDLSSITIRGGRGSFLTGTAHAVATGPPEPETGMPGCPSRSMAHGSLATDDGTYSGDFTANFLLGGTECIADLTVNASAAKDVQPA